MTKRLAWAAAVGLWLLAFAIAAASAFYSLTLPPAVPAAAHQPQQVVLMGVVVTGASVGAFLVARVPLNPIGWLLSTAACTFGSAGLLYFALLHFVYTGGAPLWLLALAASLGNLVWPLGIGLVAVYVPLYFPDGRLPSRRWLFVPWALSVMTAVNAATAALDPAALDIPGRHIANPLATARLYQVLQPLSRLSALGLLAGLAASVSSVVVRYRRGGEQLRHQLKWFAAAVVLMVVSLGVSFFNSGVAAFGLLMAISMALLPVAIAVGVLRYRLYDIDIVINKALVYGALAASIAAVYVGIVAGIGAFFGAGNRPNIALSIIATAAVAIAFQPLRTRLQRLANRLVYGSRATPYEVMAQFSKRMAESLSAEEVLPRVAEAAGRGVSASLARVSVGLPGGATRDATWPADATGEVQLRVPVRQQDEVLGEIGISKPAGESLTRSDRSLLDHLAAQAAVVFSNLRLTLELEERLEELTGLAQELQASRHRIVTAADVERRRLEAELREGAERELVLIGERIEHARALVREDPRAAGVELQELTARANQALDGLRELARGIFPPLLADKGLVAALEAFARRQDMRFEFDPRLASERLSPQLEAALYFVCVSAARVGHAAGIKLEHEGERLACSITGFNSESLVETRDRVEAVGGELDVQGENLTVHLPNPALEMAG